MKISLAWLRQLVALPQGVGWQEIARRLTFAGIEVEGVSHAGAGITGAVVAEVRGKRPHPQADKLTLVDVFDGAAMTQVVCGAPNVPGPGESGRSPRVVWARPGATLPGVKGGPLAIKPVRGIDSPGMLCAEDELGLSADHGGILILTPEDGLPIGADFAQAAGLPDTVLELNVTPNRADCLGHVGVAREVAALFRDEGAHLTLPPLDLSPFLVPEPAPVGIELAEAGGCPRYTARALYGVRVAPSPLPLRLLLARLGMRALSNVVDATNLTMLEWGQPLHAFDLHHLRGGRIVVRRARPGEQIRTLDGAVRALEPDDLLIADAERGVAVAGVMGGEDSEVSPGTTELLLESAYFHPAWVRRTARRLRLPSEAAYRFERGVDPNEGVVAASLRCALRIIELCRMLGTEVRVGEVLHDAYPAPILPKELTLRPARATLLLGHAVSTDDQAACLRALGMAVAPEGAEALRVRVPTSRADLTREADLIEEIGRIHGYDRIPARLPPLGMAAAEVQAQVRARPAAWQIADQTRDRCCALGLDEVLTFSFVPPQRLAMLGFAADDRRADPLVLHNPLREELSAMRTQLVVGLLEALRNHTSRGQQDVRLFEVSEVYLPASPPGAVVRDMPDERTRVAAVLCGARDHRLKPGKADEIDFYDVRGLVDGLLALWGMDGGVNVRPARPGEAPWLHPGVSAVIEDAAGRVRGEFGEIHPDLRQRLEIEARAFALELDLPDGPPAPLPYLSLPRFPGASRDLSFFVDTGVLAGSIVAALRGAGQPLLREVRVLDDYREPGKVPAGKKGLLLGLTYRSDERTLTDEEVQRAHDGVVAHLRGQFPIELR